MLRRHDRAMVIDGLFGRGTEHAVRDFQLARGLRSDGVVGLDTWHALLDPDTPSERLATTYRLDDPKLSRTSRPPPATARASSPPPDIGLLPAVIVGLGSRQSRWGLALSRTVPTARPT